jgi:hypothetical protein
LVRAGGRFWRASPLTNRSTSKAGSTPAFFCAYGLQRAPLLRFRDLAGRRQQVGEIWLAVECPGDCFAA